ncbi:MAG: tRNA pseudouridine(38-40) synthase TruA [Clostridia bacterium]|nr:tRNA pseudouridine(38-40) synthase TruA [Clostridia bacterium]
MARYKLTVCYDGSDYYGFQRQNNLPTVQQKLEEALSTRFQQQITVHPSGRTDAGVHAIAQVVHFDVDSEIKTSSFGYSINTLLPKDIAVTSCEKVSDEFHAQFGAKRKTYAMTAAIITAFKDKTICLPFSKNSKKRFLRVFNSKLQYIPAAGRTQACTQ